MRYLSNLYTFIEIGLNHGLEKGQLGEISHLLNDKNVAKVKEKYPELAKFIPYCKWYVIKDRNMLAMSAYMYDVYKETGILPNRENFDFNPDTERLEHWQYNNPLSFEINPETQFEFAQQYFPDCNIWNLFLAGCARMNYYAGTKTDLEQRIKFAIVEYMMRRKQFFTPEDFIDNPVLHKKYNKNYKEKEGDEDG